MKLLLTGATGFLGGEVLHRLVARGDLVKALVRAQAGEAADRLGAIGRSQQVHVVRGGLDDKDVLLRACEGVDVVIHLAGGGRETPSDDLEVANVGGTSKVVDACVQSGVKRLVFASSTAVYGPPHPEWAEPLREGVPGLRRPRRDSGTPLAAMRYLEYGRSKAEAERVVRQAAGDGGGEWVVLRPELVYGAGGAAFERIVQRVVRHPLRAAAHGLRDSLQPIHLRDAAEAFVLAATALGINRATINIAGREHVTHAAFARLIHRSLDVGATDDDSHTEALPSLMYDIRRARAELGFEPKTVLARGVPAAVRALQKGKAPRLARLDERVFARMSQRAEAPWCARGPLTTGGRWI